MKLHCNLVFSKFIYFNIFSFFIDTANNIISYIETIYNLLKKDGLWVNFGPLLYHYADME